MKTNKKNEMLFDELLKQAIKEDLEKELLLLPSEEELDKEVVFSKRHQRRMRKLFGEDVFCENKGHVVSLSPARLLRILLAAALIIGALIISAAVYAYFNPIAEFFPVIRDLEKISDLGPIQKGNLELEYTENTKTYQSIEQMEQDKHTGAMYPETEGTAFSVAYVRYTDFPDRSVVLVCMEDGCCISVYLNHSAYLTENLPEDCYREVAGRTCCILDVKNGVQATMTQDDITYVITAPDENTLENLIAIIQ